MIIIELNLYPSINIIQRTVKINRILRKHRIQNRLQRSRVAQSRRRPSVSPSDHDSHPIPFFINTSADLNYRSVILQRLHLSNRSLDALLRIPIRVLGKHADRSFDADSSQFLCA